MHLVLFNLLLAAIPIQLGLHFWPTWAMVLGRRVDFLSPTLYGTDILIVLVLVSWVFDQRKKFPISNIQFPKILVVIVFAAINIYFATSAMVALYFWMKVLEYSFLGLYIYKTKPKISATLFYLSIGVFYSSLIAIGQFVLQRSIGGPLWFLGERAFTNISPGIAQYNFCVPFSSTCSLLLRAYATFPHPNVLGGFLAVILPLIISQIKNRKQPFYISTATLGIIALVLTFSRSAWVAFLLGLGMINYQKWIKKKSFLPIIVILLCAGALTLSAVRTPDESVIVRQALNNSAIDIFLKSPVIGNGLGNFLVELPNHLVSRQIYFLQPVHNIYFLILADVGVVGLLCFLWMLKKVFEHKRTIVHYSLFTILLLGLVDHYPFTLQQGQLLFTIFLSLSLLP